MISLPPRGWKTHVSVCLENASDLIASAFSLATICAALGGLYGAWKHLRFWDESSPTDEQANKPDKNAGPERERSAR
jgi:hypothetical protein